MVKHSWFGVKILHDAQNVAQIAFVRRRLASRNAVLRDIGAAVQSAVAQRQFARRFVFRVAQMCRANMFLHQWILL